MIKHDGHLRTGEKCKKHESQVSVNYISLALFLCAFFVVTVLFFSILLMPQRVVKYIISQGVE